ncbi:MAG: hypothetical protein H0T42_15115 [Deltaproteobacteria bacterium]|nr:hypothetical protein [Deltaproteobacteria bacterium]
MPCKRIILLGFTITATATASADTEPRTTISTDPIGIVSGTYALSITHKIAKRVALRADGSLAADVGQMSGPQQVGIGAQVFLHSAGRGAYLEGGLVARHEQTWAAGVGYLGSDQMTSGLGGSLGWYPGTTHVVTFGPAVHVGWQHAFDSGMMIAAAIGATRTWASDPAGIQRVASTSYLRVGYAW